MSCPIAPNLSGYSQPCGHLPLNGGNQPGLQNKPRSRPSVKMPKSNSASNTNNNDKDKQVRFEKKLENSSNSPSSSNSVNKPLNANTLATNKFYRYFKIVAMTTVIALLGYFVYRWWFGEKSASLSGGGVANNAAPVLSNTVPGQNSNPLV